MQLKLFILSTHVPLFKHELLSHSLISARTVTVADRMHVLRRIFAGGGGGGEEFNTDDVTAHKMQWILINVT